MKPSSLISFMKSHWQIFLLFFVLGMHSIDATAIPPSIGHSSSSISEAADLDANSYSERGHSKAFKKRIRFFEKVQHFLSKKRKGAAEDRIEECDKIFLASGEELEGKVIEIGPQTIAYKKCGWPDGPTYKIERNKVSSIQYTNGTVETIVAEEYVAPVASRATSNSGKPDQDAMTAFAFAIGAMALPFLAIPGLVLSIRALKNAKRNGNESSRGFALAGLIISIVILALLILLLGYFVIFLLAF